MKVHCCKNCKSRKVEGLKETTGSLYLCLCCRHWWHSPEWYTFCVSIWWICTGCWACDRTCWTIVLLCLLFLGNASTFIHAVYNGEVFRGATFPRTADYEHSHTHTSEKSVIITSQHVTSEMNCIFLNSVLGVSHFAPSLYFYVKFVGFHSALRFSTLNNTRFSVTVTPTSPTSCLVAMPTTGSFSFCIQELLIVLLLHPRL